MFQKLISTSDLNLMKKQIEIIVENKSLFLGIAILMVLFYHQPVDGAINSIYFYPGFLGVDIFMFFSGLGLCYSYNKNNIRTFYVHRMKRIIPLYIILGLLVSLYNYKSNSFWDFFCNISTLSYYGLGGIMYEWYLSSLFVFYLFFPLLYKAVNKFDKLSLLSIVWCFIMILFSLFNIPWQFETALGRIPIFILGILCFIDKSKYKSCIYIFLIFFLISLVLYFYGKIRTYVLLYCISPVIIYCFSYFVHMIKTKKNACSFLMFMGNKSLEIYVSNCIVMKYMSHNFHGLSATVIYWFSILLLIPIMCWINNRIAKVLC